MENSSLSCETFFMPAWIRSFPRRAAKCRKLSFPSGAAKLRIAQVTLPEALFDDAVYFAPRRGGGLEPFEPQVLIGSAADLSTLAQACIANQLKLPSLSFAVYSLTGCRDMPLRTEARKMLWHAFGVPIREMLLDGDNLPLAVQCEANEGWHIEPGVTFTREEGQLWFRRKRESKRGTGLTGQLETEVCACGRAGVRILDATIDLTDPLRPATLERAS